MGNKTYTGMSEIQQQNQTYVTAGLVIYKNAPEQIFSINVNNISKAYLQKLLTVARLYLGVA